MVLFALSFILIFLSSYFIASILENKNSVKGFIYTFLISFAQIIFTSEVLSLFKQIKVLPFISFNIIFAILTTFVWFKLGKPTWKFDFKDFKNKFFNSLKLDKSLWILFFCWCFFILVSVYLIIFMPITSGDAFCYHAVRNIDWVMNHSLNHFITPDARNIEFPINSEILYMWVTLFTKKVLFFGCFTFVSYILILVSGFQIFKHLRFSLRKTLWSFFILSGLSSVTVMASGTETDLIVAGLITCSIYLFLDGLKNNPNKNLIMASLSYALAIGVKTTAIICIPAVAILFLYFSFKNKNKTALLKFVGFGVINFILFSSYNYVLNFLDFGNCMGSAHLISAHKNWWGLKGVLSSFVKHIFLFFDFSGFKWGYYLNDRLFEFEKSILTFLHLAEVPNGVFCGDGFFNGKILEPVVGFGVLSFLLVLPCWVISLLTPCIIRNNKTKTNFIFGFIFLINIVALSACVAFMTFNCRFLTTLLIISAPILTISYIKSNLNPIKYVYILFATYSLLIISTHIWARPFFQLVNYQYQFGTKEMRSSVACEKIDKRKRMLSEWCVVNGLVTSKFNDKKYKILFLNEISSEILYLKQKKLNGYNNYEFSTFEHLKDLDIDNFDIIIVPTFGQIISNFEKYSPDKIDYYLFLDNNGNNHFYPHDINSQTLCYYNSINETLSNEMGTANHIPYTKVCSFTTNFFVHHPFKIAYKTDNHFILLNKNTKFNLK